MNEEMNACRTQEDVKHAAIEAARDWAIEMINGHEEMIVSLLANVEDDPNNQWLNYYEGFISGLRLAKFMIAESAEAHMHRDVF